MDDGDPFVPAAALLDAAAVLYGTKAEDAQFCQEMERKWPQRVWRVAIRQAMASPEPPRHAVSPQFSLFGTSE